jgi:hypoxanthine phosphoribosyltransferase
MKLSDAGGIAFAYLSWSDLDDMTRSLAEMVQFSGKKYDRVIALANGGLTMVRHFADLIDLRVISEMQVAFYRGINETHTAPEVIQPLSVDITGQRILIFEDIVDSGATLEFTLDYLLKKGAAEVHTAALCRKSRASVHPEYSVQLLDRWVVFPYETRETLTELAGKWRSERLPEGEITERLRTVGFSDQDIRHFA